MTKDKLHNLVYALHDDVADTVLQYYICPDPVWAERTFKSLVNQIACGEPEEFSFIFIGMLTDLEFRDGTEIIALCRQSNIGIKEKMRGVDYVKSLAHDV